MILGTSHCVDMYANEPGDPKELVDARARIGELVAKWSKLEHNGTLMKQTKTFTYILFLMIDYTLLTLLF